MATTVTNRKDSVIGNKRLVTATVAITTNGDTWATGLKQIDTITLDPTTNASGGATASGGTITFAVGGALTMWLGVVGN